MKRIFTAFLFSLSALAVLAGDPVGIREGNKIMGHVVEDGSEENIAYAAVLVVETGAGTTSNENGQFAFTGLAPGKYTLRVTAMGYEAMSKDLQDLLPQLGLVPCVLIGHSMGGRTAMLLALQRVSRPSPGLPPICCRP